METRPNQSPNKVWLNLIFDIVLPVMILKQSARFGENGPLYALIIAISLPLGHGLYDLYKEKKINWISLLGLINVFLTGGFAVMKFDGAWFVAKETGVPAVIGLFVFFSSFSKKPLFSFFLNQPGLLATDLIQGKLDQLDRHKAFEALIRRCTLLFSGTFFLSALLNYYWAIGIFKKIPEELNDTQKAELLNSQIADMTWMGYLVIGLPLVVITTSVFYYCLRNLSKITELSINELLNSPIPETEENAQPPQD